METCGATFDYRGFPVPGPERKESMMMRKIRSGIGGRRTKEFIDAVKRDQTLQIGGNIVKNQGTASLAGLPFPRKKRGDGSRIDHRQFCQIDLALTFRNRLQAGFTDGFGVIEGQSR
jgi:hypothetical protein